MLNSPVDIAIVAGVALLLFGPKKLPELGRALGQGIGNFKKALTDAQDEVSTAINETEKKGDEKQGEKKNSEKEEEAVSS
ncbi:MAG: twin-arginine translocase TatA/TatE family subunit [Cyanobacteria bacterium HKST-UBA02]|nr:twin-arginine translocase TatA/TatE family subunit [Cyanobacteria bacterium HKST-UBA02]